MDFFRHFSPVYRAKRKALYFNASPVIKTLESATTLFIRTMRLTGVILLAFCLQVSARSDAQQRIAINVKNISLQKLFAEIEKKTNYAFFYDVAILKETKPVTMIVKDATVEEILKLALAGQALEYMITDKTIFVKKERKTVVEAVPADTSRGRVIKASGVVLTDAGVPIQGANVTIKQTEKGTITNAKGEFELSAMPAGDVLVFSFVGYALQNFTVKDEGQIRIYMKVAQNELDKAVVQGYGTTTQRLTTSDIGTVTAEEIERQPVMNPLLALQGKIAGLDVTVTNGYASAPIKVELRGRSAINTTFPSDPLYVIDGVPLTVLDPGGIGSTGFDQTGQSPAGGQSPIFSIDPMDIESIEVLKDADATAIYGSRGANGVILITTKKGKAGKTKFNLGVQEGVNQVTRFWDMMNTPQYLSMRREAFKNDGIAPDPVGDYDLNGTWNTTRYTNWQKVLWGGEGRTIDAKASLSGGDARTTFRLGAGFDHITGITTVSGGDQRASFSLNLQHNSLDQRLTFSFSSTYSYAISDMINVPNGGVTLAPDAPGIYDSLGNLNYFGWGGGNMNNTIARQAYNFSSIKQPYSAKTNFLNSNLVVGYQVIKGLVISTSLGYNFAQANQEFLHPIAAQDPETDPTGTLFLGHNNNNNVIVEPQVTYKSIVSKGTLIALLGGSYSQTQTDGLGVTGSGFTTDDLLQSISSAPSIQASENYGDYRYAALFGRLTYNWENKYLINLNARRDGSSRFGPGRQFGDFWSIGTAWIFTEENWFKDHLPALSFGKIRTNFGITGSDNIGDYGYLSRYTSTNNLSYAGVSSLVPIQNPNPDYQWQVDKKFESAVNLGFLKDRITIELAYYLNRCGNQLIAFPTPVLTGFSSVPANSPALVQNTGLEVTGAASIIQTKKFSWSINFNMAFNYNKLIAYPDFSQSPYVGILQVGKPLNISYALHCVGVDPQTGEYQFYDKNHDGEINYNPGHTGDDSYVINMSPRFFGGFGMNFSYGSFRVNLFFNVKEQLGKNAFVSGFFPGNLNQNAPTIIIGKEWQKPGDIASISRFSTEYVPGNTEFNETSDGGLTDASFIRLSNLSVSYSFGTGYIKKIGLTDCNLFFHTNNIFLITKYKGIDPETQSFGGLPPVKIIVGGINFNF
jgi:TonB-linked SusC/RagA family outer membrane protein